MHHYILNKWNAPSSPWGLAKFRRSSRSSLWRSSTIFYNSTWLLFCPWGGDKWLFLSSKRDLLVPIFPWPSRGALVTRREGNGSPHGGLEGWGSTAACSSKSRWIVASIIWANLDGVRINLFSSLPLYCHRYGRPLPLTVVVLLGSAWLTSRSCHICEPLVFTIMTKQSIKFCTLVSSFPRRR